MSRPRPGSFVIPRARTRGRGGYQPTWLETDQIGSRARPDCQAYDHVTLPTTLPGSPHAQRGGRRYNHLRSHMITPASILQRFSGKRNRDRVKPAPRRICAQGVIFLEPARLTRRRIATARTGENGAAATTPVSAHSASRISRPSSDTTT